MHKESYETVLAKTDEMLQKASGKQCSLTRAVLHYRRLSQTES